MSETVFEFERDRERQRLVAAMGRRSKSSNQCTILQCPRTGPPYSATAPSYVVPMMSFVTTWVVPYPVAQMSANQQQVTQLPRDDQDDKAELLAAKASLYDAREEAVDLKKRLHLTLRSKDDLEDQLEWYKLNFDDARMRYEDAVRELVTLQKDGGSCKRIGQFKHIFANANMGAKIEKLSTGNAASIIVLADAIVAQHRKMNRLLASLKSRNDEQATKHAKELEEVKTALANIEAELTHSRRETSLFKQHAQKLEISVHQKSRENLSMERRCTEADEKMVAYEKKIAILVKKQLRSKEVAAKLYREKKKLEENRSSGECCVCLEERPLMVFIPCGHAACCLSCGAACEICPICKGSISARSPIYFCV